MDRKYIVHKVMVKLNEVNPTLGDELLSSENINIKPLDIIINDILDEATFELIKIAPIYLLPLKKFYTNNGANVTITSDNIAIIQLPNNYVRFGYIKFPCWERSVFEALPDTSVEYIKQQNKYIRAGFVKPMVFIRGTDNKILECYTVANDQDNKTNVDFRYVEKILPEVIPDELIPLLVNITAKKVFLSLLKFDFSVGLEKEINNLLITINK